MLTQAAGVASSWLADRYEQRVALANDIQETVEALVAAIQVWQSYEDTEPRGPRRGSGAAIADWIGTRREKRLRMLNGRIDRFLADATRLAGLPEPPPQDHVLLDALRDSVDTRGTDPAGDAVRAIIARLNDKNTQLRLLAQELAAV